jgi:hypothetical protein
VAVLTISFRETSQDGEHAQASEAARARPIVGRTFRALLASAPPLTAG